MCRQRVQRSCGTCSPPSASGIGEWAGAIEQSDGDQLAGVGGRGLEHVDAALAAQRHELLGVPAHVVGNHEEMGPGDHPQDRVPGGVEAEPRDVCHDALRARVREDRRAVVRRTGWPGPRAAPGPLRRSCGSRGVHDVGGVPGAASRFRTTRPAGAGPRRPARRHRGAGSPRGRPGRGRRPRRRVAVFEDPADALVGVGRVDGTRTAPDRSAARAAPARRRCAATRGHAVARADPGRRKPRGQVADSAVELGEGQRGLAVGHGRAVRVVAHRGREGLRNGPRAAGMSLPERARPSCGLLPFGRTGSRSSAVPGARAKAPASSSKRRASFRAVSASMRRGSKDSDRPARWGPAPPTPAFPRGVSARSSSRSNLAPPASGVCSTDAERPSMDTSGRGPVCSVEHDLEQRVDGCDRRAERPPRGGRTGRPGGRRRQVGVADAVDELRRGGVARVLVRSTRVLTKKPTRASSGVVGAAGDRRADRDVRARARLVSRAASAAWSTMNRLARCSRASARAGRGLGAMCRCKARRRSGGARRAAAGSSGSGSSGSTAPASRLSRSRAAAGGASGSSSRPVRRAATGCSRRTAPEGARQTGAAGRARVVGDRQVRPAGPWTSRRRRCGGPSRQDVRPAPAEQGGAQRDVAGDVEASRGSPRRGRSASVAADGEWTARSRRGAAPPATTSSARARRRRSGKRVRRDSWRPTTSFTRGFERGDVQGAVERSTTGML